METASQAKKGSWNQVLTCKFSVFSMLRKPDLQVVGPVVVVGFFLESAVFVWTNVFVCVFGNGSTLNAQCVAADCCWVGSARSLGRLIGFRLRNSARGGPDSSEPG